MSSSMGNVEIWNLKKFMKKSARILSNFLVKLDKKVKKMEITSDIQ